MRAKICLSCFLFCLIIAPGALCKDEPQPAEGQSGLGPDAVYTAIDLRDPFEFPVFISEEEARQEQGQEAVEMKPRLSDLVPLTIQGMVWNSDSPLVIINNQVLREGEILTFPEGSDIDKAKIMDINQDGVTILYEGGAEKISPSVVSKAPAIKGGRNDQIKSPFRNP